MVNSFKLEFALTLEALVELFSNLSVEGEKVLRNPAALFLG